MSDANPQSTLRFTCHECGTHLSVDKSLSGLTAPCPKCGVDLQAPSRIPVTGVTRGVSGKAGGVLEPARARRSGSKGGGSGERRKTISASSGGLGKASEKEDAVAFIRIIGAIVLVILVVGLVFWFLRA